MHVRRSPPAPSASEGAARPTHVAITSPTERGSRRATTNRQAKPRDECTTSTAAREEEKTNDATRRRWVLIRSGCVPPGSAREPLQDVSPGDDEHADEDLADDRPTPEACRRRPRRAVPTRAGPAKLPCGAKLKEPSTGRSTGVRDIIIRVRKGISLAAPWQKAGFSGGASGPCASPRMRAPGGPADQDGLS